MIPSRKEMCCDPKKNGNLSSRPFLFYHHANQSGKMHGRSNRANLPDFDEKWPIMTASSSSVHISYCRSSKPFQSTDTNENLPRSSTKAYPRP
mmetsp:Transcript_40039/g.72138  ORF Transcript_40039/g.72138 Transcript_40039/m.72138 type:complete len:93 (-) Transcript_40039:90-368(-)